MSKHYKNYEGFMPQRTTCVWLCKMVVIVGMTVHTLRSLQATSAYKAETPGYPAPEAEGSPPNRYLTRGPRCNCTEPTRVCWMATLIWKLMKLYQPLGYLEDPRTVGSLFWMVPFQLHVVATYVVVSSICKIVYDHYEVGPWCVAHRVLFIGIGEIRKD